MSPILEEVYRRQSPLQRYGYALGLLLAAALGVVLGGGLLWAIS